MAAPSFHGNNSSLSQNRKKYVMKTRLLFHGAGCFLLISLSAKKYLTEIYKYHLCCKFWYTDFNSYLKRRNRRHGNSKKSEVRRENQRRETVQEHRIRKIQILRCPQEKIDGS